jgi:DNA polymerase II small subunit/DNA polymerase delta subunit B
VINLGCFLQDRGVSQLVERTKFAEADDSLVLEDESARMAVSGDVLSVGDVVTGVIVALRGAANAAGHFLATVIASPFPPLLSCSLSFFPPPVSLM